MAHASKRRPRLANIFAFTFGNLIRRGLNLPYSVFLVFFALFMRVLADLPVLDDEVHGV
jgi:hypothetical protein